jgi:hypothetical protein
MAPLTNDSMCYTDPFVGLIETQYTPGLLLQMLISFVYKFHHFEVSLHPRLFNWLNSS